MRRIAVEDEANERLLVAAHVTPFSMTTVPPKVSAALSKVVSSVPAQGTELIPVVPLVTEPIVTVKGVVIPVPECLTSTYGTSAKKVNSAVVELAVRGLLNGVPASSEYNVIVLVVA